MDDTEICQRGDLPKDKKCHRHFFDSFPIPLSHLILRMTSSQTSLSLSATGLRHVPFNDYPNDFTFIVGDAQYPCPSFLAYFLSPRVAAAHATDRTLTTFRVPVQDPNRDFAHLLSLVRGNEVAVTAGNSRFFRSACIELGNLECLERLFNGEATVETAIDRLCLAERCERTDSDSIAYVASHFADAAESDLMRIRLATLTNIVRNGSLKLESEDALLSFVLTQSQRAIAYASLLDFVNFEYLSCTGIADFVRFVSGHFAVLTRSLWQKVALRLVLAVAPPSNNPHCPNAFAPERICPFANDRPMEGIIAYLRNRSSADLHGRNIVTVSASSSLYGSSLALLARRYGNYVHSDNVANQWFCYDFHDRRVMPTHYAIRSGDDGWGPNGHNLKEWCLDGSNDGSSWTELDRRQDVRELDARSALATFPISHSAIVRMVRFRQTGPNCAGTHYLKLSRFELFGSLFEGVQ
jgi:hypothetical protein